MTTIFMSYRRDDTRDVCNRVYVLLAERYGPRNVFLDSVSIPAAEDFTDYIARYIEQSDVVLVMMGPGWLGDRLQEQDDLVRREVETALASDKVIIPVLVGGARMPRASELPTSISELVLRNAISLPGPEDVTGLIGAIEAASKRIDIRDQLRGPAIRLAERVSSLLSSAGAEHVSAIDSDISAEARFAASIPGSFVGSSEAVPTLVLCTTREIAPDSVAHLREAMVTDRLNRGLLIAERRLDPLTTGLAADTDGIRVLSFRELLDLLAPLDRYFAWLDHEFDRLSVGTQYVELSATKPVFDSAGREIGRSPHSSLGAYVDNWLLDDSGRQLAVLGDFGSGKSWFCLAYSSAQLKRHEGDPVGERIPVLLQLRRVLSFMAPAAGDSSAVQLRVFEEFCREHLLPDRVAPVLVELNRQGALLLICDGFDELRHAESASVAVVFRELALLAGRNAKMIVTSRRQYFHDIFEERQVFVPTQRTGFHAELQVSFDILYLSDLSRSQIREVLRKRVGDDWLDYWSTIQRTYDLLNLVRRPVMLDMVLETFPDVTKNRHTTLASLYRLYTNRWIMAVGAERSGIPSPLRLALMRVLAWRIFVEGVPDVHYSLIPAILSDDSSFGATVDWATYEREILTQTFLIRNAGGYYYFAHRSFLEYFVADHLTEAIGKGNFDSLSQRSISSEIASFMTQMGVNARRLYRRLGQTRQHSDDRYSAGNILMLLRYLKFKLRRRDLSGLVISGADLTGVDLRRTDFRRSVLLSVNVTDTDLRRTNFTGARIENLILGVRSAGKSVASSRDGRVAASAGDNTVRIFDSAMKQREVLSGPTDSITSVRFSPGGPMVACGSFDRNAMVWRLAGGGTDDKFSLAGHTGTVYDVAFDSSGSYLFTASSDARIKVWSLSDREEVLSLEGHLATIYSVRPAPDDKLLATGSFDGTVGIWDMSVDGVRGVEVRAFQRLKGHDGLVNGVSWSPSGSILATASNDHTVRLWDPERRRIRATLRGHSDTVWSVAFSPDGRFLASGSSDGTVRLWDLAGAEVEQVGVLYGHESEVWSLAFLPDGNSLASGGFDGTLRLWDRRTGNARSVVALIGDQNQRIRCAGMRITDVVGISPLQRRFLVQKGAIER